MVHLVMRDDPSGCEVVGAFRSQESAHLDVEVRNLLPEPETTYYVSSMSVDWSANEEGLEFEEGLPRFAGSDVYLVIEVGNPTLKGRLPVAAFSDREGAEEIRERQNLYIRGNVGTHQVVRLHISSDCL